MRCNDARRAARRRERGFTLIEVLVALAIIAVALAAALRATGVLAQNNHALRDKTLALVAAENRMAELRLAQALPDPGKQDTPCPQGRLDMLCESTYTYSLNRAFRQVSVRVYLRGRPDITLAELSGLLANVR
ncbi:type II secretion system protein GspI [Bordetella genomosp. 10]|uniref:Type II secretion system protein I n=1 Tax=Bordetella genomosp. 10 TaxID=1416804 RepID=A0A261S8X5_9BORD|nr:type II secretion system minor pseudopilin GspI [Bordetella genomosp. 10]OZI33834.1 type II secretion system protein GspI [Bordetella genomosp. 10]